MYWEKAFSQSLKHLNITRGVKIWKRNAQFAKNHIQRLIRRVSIAVTHALRKLAKQDKLRIAVLSKSNIRLTSPKLNESKPQNSIRKILFLCLLQPVSEKYLLKTSVQGKKVSK